MLTVRACCREALLSDEEAQEVVRLLSPTIESESERDGGLCEWVSNSSLDLEQTMTEEHPKIVTSADDSFMSTRRGSHSESESGHLGSVSSLGEQVSRVKCYEPQNLYLTAVSFRM